MSSEGTPKGRSGKRAEKPEQFERFEELTRKLMRVPKEVVNGKSRAKTRRSTRTK